MLTYTSEDAINKAAADLGRHVPGEALGAVEFSIISAALDRVLVEEAKILAINDRDEIPAMAFQCISSLTALYAASDFSNLPVDKGKVEEWEQRLRYLISQTPTYEPLQAYYF